MEVYHSWQALREQHQHEKLALALGNFDGFHLGHRTLIGCMQGYCTQNQAKSVVLLFFPHPLSRLSDNPPKLLTNDYEKRLFLTDLGVDYLILQEFDQTFSQMAPVAFVKDILVDKLRVEHLFVGFNYTFGAKAAGDTALLHRLAEEYHFGLSVLPELTSDAMTISSSAVRMALQKGSLDEANRLLGYYYFFSGEVVRGRGLGRQFGVCTANLAIEESKQLPPNGVYRVMVCCAGKLYPGIANLGTKPTVSDRAQVCLETHLLHTKIDLYGKFLLVWLIQFLRPEEKFANVKDLIIQIEKDKTAAEQMAACYDESKLLPKLWK